MNRSNLIRHIWPTTLLLLSSQGAQASGLAFAPGAANDICWQTNPQILGSVILKAGFFNIGGGHYIFAGQTTKEDGRLIAVGNGNAEINGTEINLSGQFTGGRATAMFSETIYATLDSVSLDGTLQVIFQTAGESTPEPVIFYDTSPMTRITCPL